MVGPGTGYKNISQREYVCERVEGSEKEKEKLKSRKERGNGRTPSANLIPIPE
jgi:hypothetical protein